MAYKYENLTDQPLMVPGVGNIKPRETFETDVFIENPNFKLITANPPTPPVEQAQTVASEPDKSVKVDRVEEGQK